MSRDKKQLYILCDLEGASGISPENRKAMYYGSELWRKEGRKYITSDVQAVCAAANEFGISEIILNDSHDNGHREPNVVMTDLPGNVRLVRRPYLPGKPRHMVRGELYGIIIVGQHAMHGGGGFAPHTIQSPPIGEVTINGIKVGEIGLELALFMDAKLLAVVGEEAAVEEAKGLCPKAVGVPVKSLEKDWFPPASEIRPVIREKILDALQRRDEADGLHLEPPFRFTLKPAEGYRFDPGKRFFLRWLARLMLFRLWNGQMTETEASWETRTVVSGLYALHSTRGFMKKRA
ncbi:MAG: M55 family metallopeptidase [Candidatus Bipolaricaulia bacterium]